MSAELLSMGREATVLRDGDQVCKTYRPELHPQFGDLHRAIYGEKPVDSDRRDGFFRREARVLEVLSGFTPCYIPGGLQVDANNYGIWMDYVPHPTYQEAILAGDITPVAATQQAVRILAALHVQCNQDVRKLRDKIDQGTKIRPWTMHYERNRWMRYIRTIICHESSELQEYWQERGIDPETLGPNKKAGEIDAFLLSTYKGKRVINLQNQASKSVRRIRELTGSESTFTWREAALQNCFYLGTDSKGDGPLEVKVIDFPRASINAGSNLDLVDLLFNVHRGKFTPEAERISYQIASEYYQRIGIPAEMIGARFARLVPVRLQSALRVYANYCGKSPYEIMKISGQLSRDTGLSTVDPEKGIEVKERFLDEQFTQMFEGVLDYYRFRRGEGWELYVHSCKQGLSGKDKLEIQNEVELFERILTHSGVLQGRISSKRRAEQVRRLQEGVATQNQPSEDNPAK